VLPAEPLDQLLGERLVAQVAPQRRDLSPARAQLCGDRFDLFAQVGDHDPGTLGGQRRGDGGADPPARTRDQR